jgi:hypothetical protein
MMPSIDINSVLIDKRQADLFGCGGHTTSNSRRCSRYVALHVLTQAETLDALTHLFNCIFQRKGHATQELAPPTTKETLILA